MANEILHPTSLTRGDLAQVMRRELEEMKRDINKRFDALEAKIAALQPDPAKRAPKQ